MAAPQPIAIIGMSFRGPGDAHNIEAFWDMINNGESAWSKVPAERWNADAFYHPDVEAAESHNAKGGHFIKEDVAAFDAGFFGIQPAEARAMDPQQRLLLELAWEAFENAGADINALKQSDTGVYVAQFGNDYENIMFKDTRIVPAYGMTGTGLAITANRISYIFDLRGPSFVLDTGCSGSGVALHQACKSLRAKESKMALVGGTNLLLSPDVFQPMSTHRVLNSDGRCYTFDHRGEGYGRGEGVGCVVLKLLDDAIRDGDAIRSIILNTGSNQDGKTNGISLPNQYAQEDLIRATYAAVGLDTKHTSYVEAHGTGTQAGDKIEITAIANTFTEGKDRPDPLIVGTVKTNLGHLEAASGVAGIIKTVLAMERGTIPPHLNFEKEREGMHLTARNIKLPLSPIPFPENADGVRRASVNSFGYGGTNAHTILESPRSSILKKHGLTNGYTHTNGDLKNGHIHTNGDSDDISPLSDAQLYVFSARSQHSVSGILANTKKWIETHSETSQLSALSNTLLTRRSAFPWRTTIVASSAADLIAKLGQPVRPTKEAPNTSITMVFSGQGAQWYAMGRELIFTKSRFRESILKSESLLEDLGATWQLTKVLLQDETESIIDRSDVSQPTCTALQIALVDLLESMDIRPDNVIGHSSGEMAAAYAAGALTHESAITAAYHRGFTASAVNTILQTTGAMMAVGLDEDATSTYLKQLKSGKAVVACVNSPKSVTVSGDSQAIDELKILLDSQGNSIFSRKLKVDTAYHSHHMAVVAKEYLQKMAGLENYDTKKSVQFFSSVTGELKSTDFGPQYWVDNLLGQVKFSETLEILIKKQKESSISSTQHLVIEIGPHAALQGPISQTITSQKLEGFKHSYYTALLRKKDAVSTVLELAGKIFEAGYKVNLGGAARLSVEASSEIVTDLAPYAWDHSSTYWAESRLSQEHRFRQHANHDTLGLRVVHSTVLEPIWRNVLQTAALPWLKDHVVDGMIVFPGTGYLCMAFEAMRQMNIDRQVQGKISGYKLRDIHFLKALVISDNSDVEIQFTLKPSINDRGSSKWEDFKIFSRADNGTWSEHCRGSVMTKFETATDEVEGSREVDEEKDVYIKMLNDVKAGATTAMSSKEAYELLKSRGNFYGPTFAALTDFSLGDMAGLATLEVPDVAAVMPSKWLSKEKLHAATFDAIHHLHLVLLFQATKIKGVMPTTIAEVDLSIDLDTAAGDRLTTVGSVRVDGARTATCESFLYHEDRMLLSLRGAELKAVGESAKEDGSQISTQQRSHEFRWEADVDFLDQEIFAVPRSVSTSKNNLSADDHIRLVDTVACHHVKSCLKQLDEANFTPTQKHHIALVDWMRRYVLSDEYAKLMNGPDLETCLQQLKGSGPDIELLQNVAPYLAQVVQGQVEAIELMMKGDVLHQFYAENIWCKPGNDQISAYFRAASFKNPELKIIEIGAGTGSATLAAIEAVSRTPEVWMKHFTFTDVSSGFFGKAQSKFEQWSDIMDYQVLDIEKDPVAQGFQEGAYDFVLASNVLHATPDMSITLRNVRKLLKPWGRLVLLEMTKTTPSCNCIFGALAGWWAGAHEGRVDSPLLSTQQWSAALKLAGFGELELATDILGNGSVYVTSALPRELTANGKLSRPLQIITTPSAITKSQYRKFSEDLLDSFKESGYAPEFADLPSEVDTSVKYVVLEDGAEPLLRDPTEETFKKLTNFMATADVLWVSGSVEEEFVQNPNKGIMTGFQRCARAESGSRTIQYIDVQDNIATCSDSLVKSILSMVHATEHGSPKLARGIEPEYIYRDGQLMIPRVVLSYTFNEFAAKQKEQISDSLYQQPQRPVQLHVGTPGLLDTMVFVEDPLPAQSLGTEDIEIETQACGINFKDVYIALGQMKSNDSMVGEVSGVIARVGSDCQDFKVGDRVCAWNAAPFASCARANVSRVAHIPDNLSFAEAASIPVVFMTAYHALIEKGNLQKGESVLIHAGAGGVGQAAIQIAQSVGAQVFVTVGSASKKELIKEVYSIPDTHIFSSKLRNFKTGVLRLTNGRGVDVVLNSLSGEALLDSWACVASLGTFVEIGKTDIYQNTHIGMLPFAKSISFVSFDLGFIAAERPAIAQNTLRQVATLLKQGTIKPVYPIIKMPITSIEDAFRLIQARKHTGKVVLEANADTTVRTKTTLQPSSFGPASTFIIAGGLGDLGREMCRFLASHGATHVVSLSRSGADAETANAIKEELRHFGTGFHPLKCDVTKEDQVKNAASYVSSLPPVKAVIQAAMVLKDMSLESMTLEDFEIAVKPKVLGTQYLTETFKEAETFIFLSSCTSVVGNRGQANYAAGCTYQDTFAQYSIGTAHSVSLNLPLMFGSAAMNEERRAHMAKQGVLPTTLEEFYVLLDYALSADCRVKGIKELVTGLSADALRAMIGSLQSANSMFCHVTAIGKSSVDVSEDVSKNNAHLGITADLAPEEIHSRLCNAIASRISTLAAIDHEEVALDVPILEFGLDSLVAIELKNWLTRTFSTSNIETGEILVMPSIDALAVMIAQRSSLVKDATNGKTDDDRMVPVKEKEEGPNHNFECCRRTEKLRRLPLLDLPTLFKYHLANHRAIWSEEEYQNTCKAAIEFQEPGSIGQKLYSRLVERYKTEENWLTEITTRTIYLDRRYSLVKSNVGGAHRIFDTDKSHTQTERAAIIALTAFKFKLEYESGNMEPANFRGNYLCMRGHKWLFHASREPRHGSDETIKFSPNNTITVLHRGNVFKVDMVKDGELPTIEQLKATFQTILDMPKETSAITMVTTLERDEWTEVYQRMKLDPVNKASIETVERSAFVISLEDATPTTPQERMDCFLLGDGSNRWYDKSISFIVCANGVSGFSNEHSQIDGATLALLNGPIMEAVRAYEPVSEAPEASPLDIEACEFNLTPDLESILSRARQSFLSTVSNIQFELTRIPLLSPSFLAAQQLHAGYCWEIVTQIASRLFFGKQLASWTAVLMDMYHLGRPDVVQVCTPVVVSFIDAAIKEIPAGEEAAVKKDLRIGFRNSLKDLTSAIQSGELGHVHDRTFTAMEWVLKPNEEAPTLFKSDPGYYNSRPRHIMCGQTIGPEAFGEVGFVLMDPKSVWTVYSVMDYGAEYSIVNAGGNARRFADCLQRAAAIVQNFLTD